MENNPSGNKRIAKNTLLLYFRMLLTILVGLYTSRVVLNTLGISDYGVYNIVGGVVTMLAFLNSAMVAASQRFISFELGTGDLEKLKKGFLYISIHTYNFSHSYINCCRNNWLMVCQCLFEYSSRQDGSG